MRPLDRQELIAASGGDLVYTLEQSIHISFGCAAAFNTRDDLLCLLGVAPVDLMGDLGVIWLVGTTALDRHPLDMHRNALRYIRHVRQFYPRLFNYVDARNAPSIRWLSRLGFTIDPPVPFGVQGRPFHRFHLGFDDV